jgi:4-amino-4-deoxy-L-arabinose transferase-like glycosyltransferase
LLGLLALTALLYFWNLTVSGYANTYYSAAALAGSQSWPAFFFGSFDAANFISVDKPPIATMLMGLSVRLFGLSSASILAPQALAGVASVGFLFAAVRRSNGPVAALTAGLILALTPAAVLIFRFNNPDALLTALLVAAAWALLHSLDRGSLRWVGLAASLVGTAFLTKYLQAYLVLPAFALVFGLCARASWRRRLLGLGVAALAVLLSSAWWVAIVELLPAGAKPFTGGSTSGSPLDLIFGYDGLGRLFGAVGPSGGGNPGGAGGFAGSAGILRLFNDSFFGEIAWLLPLAALGLIAGLWFHRRAPGPDLARAGVLLWGGWLLVTGLVFSFMSGIIHSYYAVALAPAVAALVGIGLTDLWQLRRRHRFAGSLVLGGSLAGSAGFAATLLARSSGFVPGLAPLVVGLGAGAGAVLVLSSLPRSAPRYERITALAMAAGFCVLLLAPGAYDWSTLGTAYAGGDPHPGPGIAQAAGSPSTFGAGPTASTGAGGSGEAAPPNGGPAGVFSLPGAPFAGTAPFIPGNVPPGAGPGAGDANSSLEAYLVAHRGQATWIVAADGSAQAGTIELDTRLPVMAMGGFSGSDPVPTTATLQADIAAGKLRYVLIDQRADVPGGGLTANARTAWVISACRAVSLVGEASASGDLYDCAGAK